MGPLAAGTIVASAVQLGVSKETPVHAKRGIHPPRFPYFDYTRYTFSMGVEKRGFLWLSGQTAAEYDPVRRQTVCKGDLVEQTRVVYEKLRLTLEAGGAGFADVVKTVDYVTPAARPRYRDTAAVRREYFGNSFPAATGVVIERLLRPDALIEVEAIAHIDAQPKRPVNLGLERFAHLTYQPAVEGAGILWISGHMAQEAASGTGAPVYRGGIVEQTRTIYERVLLILEAAGANFGDVVKLVEYVAPAGLEDYPAVRSLRREYFGHDLPPSTMLVVTQLLHPAAHIAIDMVAVTGTTKKISIHPAWSRPDPEGLWSGVQKGPLLFISGQFGVDPRAATSVGRGDLLKQTRQAYGNVQSIVEAAGARMDDVVKTVEFLVPSGLHDYRRTAEIRREYFQEPYPAATGVVVQGLPQPDWLIAVDAVAVVSEVKPVADGQ